MIVAHQLQSTFNCGRACKLLSALLVVFFSHVSSASAKQLPEQVSVWKLIQSSKVHGDHLTIFVGEPGLKWSNPQTGVSILCLSPSWNVIAYNEKRKRFMQTPLSSFHGHASLAIRHWGGYAFEELKLSKVSIGKVNGLVVEEYGLSAIKKMFVQQSNYRKVGVSLCEYRICRGLPSEIKAGLLLARLYSLPDCTGVPFSFQFRRKPVDELRTSLKTWSSVRTRVPVNEFSFPNGFKRVQSFGELMDDASSENGIEGLMDSLGKPLYK